ncbi:PAS domain-containing hybrid sensor histidine kinase/response regulator [Desulforamulus ruminis]|uniref:Circadian input-output histidine kinase CikA n=1 Tax=Desulforamulus ruminis (strain ATCC 23193 / DSM 2154 / NCIMB 8452 / DL) TaxID=696281 RepID=F6DSD7_DESRL|nr:response regulator [Desulforamulus ruminis]AEG59916.1 PAS sensor protein [Desulforamulus ruminis DSM 2154]
MREKLIELLNQNEDRVIEKLINFAKAGGFTRFTSTRHDDWHLSVREIIQGLSTYLMKHADDVVNVHDAAENPACEFGVRCARMHRARGITLKMFLGLFKYYRRAYLDMVNESYLTAEEKQAAKKSMNTYFDRLELGFCSEWAGEGKDSRIHELQLVNRHLTNEKNKLRTIFESMTECVFVVDPQMCITEINSAAAAYFEVQPEEVIGMTCSSLLGCDCKQEECHLYIAMNKAGCYKDVEVEVTTKRGRRRLLTSGSFLHDISGKYAGGVQVFVDVTEKYRMEQELRLHMQANNSSSECITIFDESAQLIYANPEAEKMLGKGIKELLGLGIEDVYPEGERILFFLIRGNYWRGELLLKQGLKEIIIEVHATPIRRSIGQIIGFHVAAKDITEQKAIQIKLQQAREDTEREAAKLRAIISMMGAFIALADAEGTITEVNEKVITMTGEKKANIIGKKLWDIHQGDTLEKVQELIKKYQEQPNQPPLTFTRIFCGHDVIMNIQPIYRDANYDGILLMVIDVTEVAESKRQAEQAREIAEKASQAKSEFLANMSHEIRTPMNGILGFAEVLAQQGLNQEQQESVKIIRQCGEQLMDLINDILDLSKIESGKLILEETVFSLRKMIYETVNVIEPILMEKNVEMKISIDPHLPDYLKGDSFRIRQILNNLLSNAAKFTHEGCVEVKVQGERTLEKTDHRNFVLTFIVSDTGIGIPSDKLAEIFETFTQADGSTTRKYGGTGLGLTISRSLTELMGGQLQVQSEFKKGSQFSLTLPVALVHVEKKLAPQQRKEGSTREGVVLVIEDDWTTKQLITNYLEKAGYTVIATDHGKQALTLAKIYQPDAIILDILLPDLSGWDILVKMKKTEEIQQIPVIVCSVLPEKERAFSLGAVDYIEKPISEEILISRLEKLTLSRTSEDTHIILVDDDKTALEFLRCVIEGAGFKPHPFMLAQEALDFIFRHEPVHAVILDLLMPGMDGFDFLDHLRSNPKFKSLPVLINTGKDLTQQDYQKLNDKYERILNKSYIHPEALLRELNLLIRDGVQRKPVNQKMKKGPVNVLLVEDNSFNQKLIEHLLTGDGYKVTMVENGQEALAALDQGEYDIVLMDMQMPVMDGYEATRQIRNMEKYKKLPVIALTAHAMKGDCEKCLSAGCDDYLAKPVNKDMLIKTIKKFTDSPAEESRGKKTRIRDKGIELLVPWYLQDLAGEMDKLKEAARINDLVTVRYISHGLKGSGGAYGFPELSNLGAEIERAAVNQDLELVRSLVNQLRELYTEILEEEL